MLNLDQLRTAKPEDITSELGYSVEPLLHTAQLALECDHSGTTTIHREGAAADTLALARVLVGPRSAGRREVGKGNKPRNLCLEKGECGMNGLHETDIDFIRPLRKFEETERLILLTGTRARASGALDLAAFETWTEDLIRHHRTWEDLIASDLDVPPKNAERAG